MQSSINIENIYRRMKETLSGRSTFILTLLVLFFLPLSVNSQVLTNTGAFISITGGTYVEADTVKNNTGTVKNDGTINLSGPYINAGNTQGNGLYNIKGNWRNTGTFTPGTSTVRLLGSDNQFVTSSGPGSFNKLVINNSGAFPASRIFLNTNILVSGFLELTSGNIETGPNKIFLSNGSATSLIYTSGRIIGKFERGINSSANYLFPIGSENFDNPANIGITTLSAPGSVLAEFIDTIPLGIAGLPIEDDSSEIYEVYEDGFWSMTANGGFDVALYDINLTGNGFTEVIADSAIVIKRDAPDGDWEVDGVHEQAVNNVAYRNDLLNGIRSLGNHFGLARGRPNIKDHPEDFIVCEGDTAFFAVRAVGPKPLTYQWQVNDGTGWINLPENVTTGGSHYDTLFIIDAGFDLNGYQYRVSITDRLGRQKYSDSAQLTVELRPVATATAEDDILCNGETTQITVVSSLPGSTFNYEVLYSGGITGAVAYTEGDTIRDELGNPGTNVDSVIYRIIPYGPGARACVGTDDTTTIRVEPNPNIQVSVPPAVTQEAIYCNGAPVDFDVNNFQLTTGTVKYDLIVSDLNNVIIGERASESNVEIIDFIEYLSHDEDTIQRVTYRFIPYIENISGNKTCQSTSIDTLVTIDIVPKLSAIENDSVLYGGYNITCHGLSDGIVELIPVGGDLRHTYEIVWENESGDLLQTAQYDFDTLFQQPAGIYTYFITDTIGCSFTDTLELTEPDTLAIDSYTIIKPNCYGEDPTAEIHVDLSGGVEINDYYWEYKLIGEPVGDGGEDLYDVKAGTYQYIFKDYHLCKFDTTFVIPPANYLDYNIQNLSEYGNYNVSCYGASDGLVEAIGLGGKPDYNYKWYDDLESEPMATTPRIDNLTSGIYYLWLEDANGCLLGSGQGDSIIAIDITEPDPISIVRDIADQHPGGWDVSCFGNSDGKLTLQYLGGHTEYLDNEFSWSEDASGTDSIKVNLAAGIYTVEVTDAHDCVYDSTFTLYEPPQITYDTLLSGFAGTDNISCFGESDGYIRLNNVSGGGTTTEPGIYTYLWTAPAGVTLNDPTAKDQENLPAGVYYFTITDQIDCSVTGSVVLTQPDPFIALPDSSLRNGFEISCFNGADGWVSLTPQGGTRPYSYTWSEPGGTDTIISGLTAGYYSVEISDANGCTNFYEWQLEDPDTIVLNADPNRLIECYGDTSTIMINPAGGVGDYTYTWDGVPGNRSLNGVEEGTYHVVVTDDNGCIAEDSLYIGQRSRIMPEIIVRSDYNGRDVSCFDASDAALEFMVTGGNPGYTFGWNTDPSDNNKNILSGLTAGVYEVTGTDASGCAFDTSLIVREPQAINTGFQADDPLCAGHVSGRISLSVTGGTPLNESPIYNYSLNGNDHLPAPVFESLPEGEYTVIVVDANDCADTTVIVLEAPQSLVMEYETTPAECKDEADGTLTINLIEGGTPPYFINKGTSYYFDNLGPGDFIITLVDGNNCVLTDTAVIEAIRLSCLSIPNAFTPNGDGANDFWMLDDDYDGTNDMYLYPNAELRIYNRWGELVYHSTDVANEPWDGTYNGRELPVDSYHYVLDLGNDDPPITGNVTIIR
ncbi:MAG: gliding motility-associated C-terminal domain-containing protein [Bacteroidales bacterium]